MSVPTASLSRHIPDEHHDERNVPKAKVVYVTVTTTIGPFLLLNNDITTFMPITHFHSFINFTLEKLMLVGIVTDP